MFNGKISVKERQTIYIDGSNFNSRKTFTQEIKSAFCFEDSLNIKNWNVMQDCLYGGYGIIDYREEFILIWQNFKKSQHKISEKELREMLDLLQEMDHIDLVFY